MQADFYILHQLVPIGVHYHQKSVTSCSEWNMLISGWTSYLYFQPVAKTISIEIGVDTPVGYC